jgi:hypothetical protein
MHDLSKEKLAKREELLALLKRICKAKWRLAYQRWAVQIPNARSRGEVHKGGVTYFQSMKT